MKYENKSMTKIAKKETFSTSARLQKKEKQSYEE